MAKTNRKTWLHWMQEVQPEKPIPATDELIDRDDVIAEVECRGFEVNEITLGFWERIGILPRAIRRWRGVAMAFYPPCVVDSIVMIRTLQRQNLTIAEMKPVMVSMVPEWITQERSRQPIDARILRAYAQYDRARSDVVTEDMDAFAAAVRPLLPWFSDAV